MKHLFIPYPLAVLAKEKGFNEDCFSRYNPNGAMIDKFLCVGEDTDYTATMRDLIKHRADGYIEAPLYQQIVDWFREKHKIKIVNTPSFVDNMWGVWKPNTLIKMCNSLDEAIEEAFKLI